MKIKNVLSPGIISRVFLLLALGFQTELHAQITIYQFRHVPDEKVEEFVKRETTYWSQVAQKAVDNKKMNFWALLEKIGGDNMAGSSNYLFVNTYSNIDTVFMGGIWNTATTIFPDVPMDKMETGSLSTTQSMYFLHDEDWAQAETAKPDNDFKYVVMNFHNSTMPDSFITLEKKYWKPFIQTAMNKKQTKQKAWGNANLLSPTGGDIKFNSVSYDLFATLQDALLTPWDPKTVFPLKGLTLLDKLRVNNGSRAVYRVVKVVSAP